MPSFQYNKHSLHCVLGRIEQFKQLYAAHVLNHFLGRRTKWTVGVILLQIGLKRLSVTVVLDLLDKFTNTVVFGLFHNRMWQSGHSEVDVNFRCFPVLI